MIQHSIRQSTAFLLDNVFPSTRKLLILRRLQAMNGELAEAVESIDKYIESLTDECWRDRVALASLQAELLYLAQREADALVKFNMIIDPLMSMLTNEERFAMEQNRINLQLGNSADGVRQHYNTFDQREILGFQWLKYQDLFWARQNAESGKHYEVLPVLWRQHRRAYSLGCWQVLSLTDKLLAQESIALKRWDDATHHAILAKDDSLMPAIANGILTSRDANLVGQVVERIVHHANLVSHFVPACKLLIEIADAVPDKWISPIGEWLLRRARIGREPRFGENPVRVAWDTIAVLAHRFTQSLAHSVLEAAIIHPAWVKAIEPKKWIPDRENIILALTPLTSTLTAKDMRNLGDAAVPLLTERMQSIDYDKVIDLLCSVASHSSSTFRKKLGMFLYPRNRPVLRALWQVAHVFGKENKFSKAQVKRLAQQVTKEVRLQVQVVYPGQQHIPVPEQFMEFTSPGVDCTLKVFSVQFFGLHAIVKHRSKMDSETTLELVSAICDMALNADNFCTNRTALLLGLIGLADVVPLDARHTIVSRLLPVAQGVVEESLLYDKASEAENPLNAFKHRHGKPEEVQAMALIAVSELVGSDSASHKRFTEILEDCLCDPRAEIRRAGYRAARRLPKVSEGVILSILTGLRDPDPNAATSAFSAIAHQSGWKFTRDHWRVFLMAVRFIHRTADAEVRMHAAEALMAWSRRCPRAFMLHRDELREMFRNDVCWSVRSAISSGETRAGVVS